MPIIENNTVVVDKGIDGFVNQNQAYHMIRKYSDAYRYIQFDICEVKEVYIVGNNSDAGLYGAIQGRLVTSEKNTTLKNRWIKPFSLRDFDLPSENEYVMVFEYGVPPEATELYYNIANKHNLSLAEMSLAFVNDRPFVTSNIIGATNMEQLKENINSINLKLSKEIISEINLVSEKIPNPAP